MNPRYPQQQAAPVDGMTRQLQQLAALKGLGGHQQLEQQQLSQNDDASRMTAALHLLGLQQQGQEQQGMQDFRGKQLALEGQRNQSEDAFRQSQLQQEQQYHQAAIRSQIAGDASRLPGANPNDFLKFAGAADPVFADLANQQQANARAQAMERAYGVMQVTKDPAAREMVGRTSLAPFPGAFEEVMNRINGPAPAGPADLGLIPSDLQSVLGQAQSAQVGQQQQQQVRGQQNQQNMQHQNIIDYINSILGPKSVSPAGTGGTKIVAPAGGSTFIPATGY